METRDMTTMIVAAAASNCSALVMLDTTNGFLQPVSTGTYRPQSATVFSFTCDVDPSFRPALKSPS